MKIKHWQGYGSVNMQVIQNTPDYVKIDVSGLHEYGLERDDRYDVCKWLLNKVKGHKEDLWTNIKGMTLESYEDNLGIEHCTYTITLR